jgi:glycogen debranching enzyme
MLEPRISILSGSTFVVSDSDGDITGEPGDGIGLFFRDVRHLSRWKLTLNGARLDLLASYTADNDRAVFFLSRPIDVNYRSGTTSRGTNVAVHRDRTIGHNMVEKLEVSNFGTRPFPCELTIQFEADFTEIYATGDEARRLGTGAAEVGKHHAVLRYHRLDYYRETTITAPDGDFTEKSLTFKVKVPPAESWCTTISVNLSADAPTRRPRRDTGAPVEGAASEWIEQAPRMETDSDDLQRIYRRSLADLAALRFNPAAVPDSFLPAAGPPWSMALIGRVSLIASYQALPFMPELCRTTLHALAAQQATQFDAFRDAEPGKVLHELRDGELTHFRRRPQSPYYGSHDATPLFLILLDEYERWTGDAETVNDLEPNARAAIRWMMRYGDTNGDGYLEYDPQNRVSGLVDHCWRDSGDAIVWPDGRLVDLPRTTCELQGYAFDARCRVARLAREFWGDEELAYRLERDAAELKERFNRDFWLPDRQYYALALDGHKRPVPTLTSNVGHLLWSGIVPDEHVDALVSCLLGQRLFSGWGVRTIGENQSAYNPMGRYNGAVWPHDTALAAAGLARYGRREAAVRLSLALLDAARSFDFRLPEAIAGFDRRLLGRAVQLPGAASTHAWSSGAPLLLLRVLLGMEPSGDGLSVAPNLAGAVGYLALLGVPGRWGRQDARSRSAR